LADHARDVGHPAASVRRWADLWNWQGRFLAWDRNLDQRRQNAAESALEEMTRRHIELAQQAQRIVAMAMSRKLKTLEESEFADLKANEISRMLDVAAKLERLSRGEATEIPGQAAGYEKLSDDDLLQLDKIRKKL